MKLARNDLKALIASLNGVIKIGRLLLVCQKHYWEVWNYIVVVVVKKNFTRIKDVDATDATNRIAKPAVKCVS